MRVGKGKELWSMRSSGNPGSIHLFVPPAPGGITLPVMEAGSLSYCAFQAFVMGDREQ